jgi:hypothetical protein
MKEAELPCRRNFNTFEDAGYEPTERVPASVVAYRDERIEAAKHLCATCPLIEQCRADLEKMVRAGWEPWGVRAGLDVTEQAALARKGWLCKQCESNPVEVRGLPCDSCVTAAVQVRREAMAS